MAPPSRSIGRVLGFTLLLSLVTGMLFGLVPAMQASRADLNITLKETGARGGSGLRQNKARGLLVMVEMALAMVLLVGGGPAHPHVLGAAQRGARLRSAQRADHGYVAHRERISIGPPPSP